VPHPSPGQATVNTTTLPVTLTAFASPEAPEPTHLAIGPRPTQATSDPSRPEFDRDEVIKLLCRQVAFHDEMHKQWLQQEGLQTQDTDIVLSRSEFARWRAEAERNMDLGGELLFQHILATVTPQTRHAPPEEE
jgi:hypothetical protein